MSKHPHRALRTWAKTPFAAAAALVALGCRPESAPASARCGAEGQCPEGSVCVDAVCRAEEAPHGGAVSVAKPVVAAPRRVGHGPQGAPRLQWEVPTHAHVTAAPTFVERDGASVAIVATHAGRVFGVVVDGDAAGTVVVDAYVDGIVWSDPLAPGDGTVYVGADDDRVHAIAIGDGTVRWSTRLGDCDPPRAPGPVGLRCDVDGGPVLAPGGDLYAGADGLYRLGRDGAVKWRYPADDAERFHVGSKPLSTDTLVVFGAHDGQVHAVDHEGKVKWTVALGGDVDGDPALAADGSIVIGGDNGRVHALDPVDGTLRWVFATGRDIRSGIAVGPAGELYAGSFDGNLYALSGSGAVRFIVPTGGPIPGTPEVDAEGTVFFGSRDGRVYAVSSAGEVKWNVQLPADVEASVAVGPAGTLVVATDDGYVRGLK